MAARFKKASRVRLVNEEEDNLLEDDLEEVVESSLSEGENESPRERERGASPQEESERHGSPEGDLYVWWRRGWRWLCCGKKQYHVRPSSKSVFCRVNSWKAVFIALFAFTMAMIISVLLSRLLREPDTSGEVPFYAVVLKSFACQGRRGEDMPAPPMNNSSVIKQDVS